MRLSEMILDFAAWYTNNIIRGFESLVDHSLRLFHLVDTNAPKLFIKECAFTTHWRWQKCKCQPQINEPQRVGFLFHQEQEAETVTVDPMRATLERFAAAVRASGVTIGGPYPQEKNSPPPVPEFFTNKEQS